MYPSSKSIVDVYVRVAKICYIYKRVIVLKNITNMVLRIDAFEGFVLVKKTRKWFWTMVETLVCDSEFS